MVLRLVYYNEISLVLQTTKVIIIINLFQWFKTKNNYLNIFRRIDLCLL